MRRDYPEYCIGMSTADRFLTHKSYTLLYSALSQSTTSEDSAKQIGEIIESSSAISSIGARWLVTHPFIHVLRLISQSND
mmetsp:Transcript_9971/g.27265  ORF Transcript_9971/g.27265 Transcript_9971/m.27265 type:complete len:80 (-) Transcript_9971:1653-1892(-)